VPPRAARPFAAFLRSRCRAARAAPLQHLARWRTCPFRWPTLAGSSASNRTSGRHRILIAHTGAKVPVCCAAASKSVPFCERRHGISLRVAWHVARGGGLSLSAAVPGAPCCASLPAPPASQMAGSGCSGCMHGVQQCDSARRSASLPSVDQAGPRDGCTRRWQAERSRGAAPRISCISRAAEAVQRSEPACAPPSCLPHSPPRHGPPSARAPAAAARRRAAPLAHRRCVASVRHEPAPARSHLPPLQRDARESAGLARRPEPCRRTD
jgi:hypothetical protein